MDGRALIQRYIIGDLSDAEVEDLEASLESSLDLRLEYVRAAATDTVLREVAFERATDAVRPEPIPLRRKRYPWVVVACLAAIVLLMLPSFVGRKNDRIIGQLASSEDAAWESPLPTTPGSCLTAGELRLVAGLATIRFTSGAEVLMESPAALELLSPMRGRLLSGTAVVNVPEPAVGFVLETPDGYVVDHGTSFAVSVAETGGGSGFEVIEGEISVHLSTSGKQVRLGGGQSASIHKEDLTKYDGHLPATEIADRPQKIRIGTQGRATSVIRNNQRRKRLDPDVLTVKKSEANAWDRRVIMEFDVSGVDLNSVQSVSLRLNQVPAVNGTASRLPKINRFAVYGLTNDARRNWQLDCLWEEAPAPEDGLLVGRFQIHRSKRRGHLKMRDPALLDFLKRHGRQPVTLILVRETEQIVGVGPSLVHTFASDSHPEASGPMLEFVLN